MFLRVRCLVLFISAWYRTVHTLSFFVCGFRGYVPTRSEGRGLMSKMSIPCIFPRISRRSRPVACSRSVGTVPGSAPGGNRSSGPLISNHQKRQSSSLILQLSGSLNCPMFDSYDRLKPAAVSVKGWISPSNGSSFPCGSPGFGSHLVALWVAGVLSATTERHLSVRLLLYDIIRLVKSANSSTNARYVTYISVRR